MKAWWCGNPLHSPWKAAIDERTGDARHSSGCPQCAHVVPSPDWNFKIICPEQASLWDYDLNNDNPEDYTPYSNQYKWFKCETDEHPSFKAMISRMSDGYSCPRCPHEHTRSKQEDSLAKWIAKMFPLYADEIESHRSISIKQAAKLIGKESSSLLQLAIFIPSLKIAFEYNGEYWYSDEMICNRSDGRYKTADECHDKKTAECKHAGIGLMFIWEDDWMNDRNSMKRVVIDSIQHAMDIHDA